MTSEPKPRFEIRLIVDKSLGDYDPAALICNNRLATELWQLASHAAAGGPGAMDAAIAKFLAEHLEPGGPGW